MALDVYSIKEENGALGVAESMETPMGAATDDGVAREGHADRAQDARQAGAGVVEVDFADGKASGKMSMGGQDRPIGADLGGALFADGRRPGVRSGACHWRKATPPRSATSPSRRRR